MQEPLKLPLQLTWRRSNDMPFEMSNYVQSIVIQGRLYVGGGHAGLGSNNHYIVMQYDIGPGIWTTLSPYKAYDFAMAMISNQLVLVGGEEHEHGSYSRVLGVWGAEGKAWIHLYPEMPSARSRCSVVVYNEWLVVAGGVAGVECLSCVEVLNTDSKQWYAGPPTPTPWDSMKTAVVGDMGYFMGGWDSTGSTMKKVYISCLHPNSTIPHHLQSLQ